MDDWVQVLLGKKFSSGQPRDESGRWSSSGGLSFSSTSDAVVWGRNNYQDWKDSLSSDEKSALANYASHNYLRINETLRNEQEFGDDFYGKLDAKYAAGVESALSKGSSPVEFIAKRGISEDFADKLEVGDEFQDLAFTSTSLNPEHLWFGRMMSIKVPKGTPGGFLDWPDGTLGNPGETEFLLQKGLKYKVLSRDPSGNLIAEVVQ